jgi:membrane protease YdiL (CAAX protease family)
MHRLLGDKLQFDWRIATVTVVSTLLLIVDAYHALTPVKSYDRLILYLVIPLAIILLVFREHPRLYGLTVGDWRAGVLLTLCAAVLITPVLWLIARGGSMQSYYGAQLGGLPWSTLLELVGWEFFFRGFILFAYARRFGPDALWLQAVPFALAHIGKPEIETLSTIFGGFAFGWLAYRTRSFVYPFLLHWYIATLTILLASRTVG